MRGFHDLICGCRSDGGRLCAEHGASFLLHPDESEKKMLDPVDNGIEALHRLSCAGRRKSPPIGETR